MPTPGIHRSLRTRFPAGRPAVLATIAAAVLGAAAPAAQAQGLRIPPIVPAIPLVDATDPETLASLMRNEGVRAEVEMRESGPVIRSGSDGINFFVYVYGCSNVGTDCRSIQWAAGVDMSPAPTLERINDWNRRRTIGKAHPGEDGLPRVNHFVTLHEGVTVANFGHAFEAWRIALRDFVAHIGFR
jgi:hypothetical protein